MKKRATLFLGVFAAVSLNAQEIKQAPAVKEYSADVKYAKAQPTVGTNGKEAVIWSEDFANGIPSTWNNECFDAGGSPLQNGQWEYRGPATTPTNAQGSRGAYGGAAPIVSPTASNGFVIFDSDYLDNNGVVGAFGTGAAPSPHIGVLTTDTIDLTGHPDVQVTMSANARNFQSRFLVAISNDGGVTYTDTANLLPNLGVNSATTNPVTLSANISAAAGNQANVVMQIIFDGDYYYWMVDDIEISDLPQHEVQFTSAAGAPKYDIIYDGGNRVNAGHMSLEQVSPMAFDCNLYNFGVQAQTNLTMQVEIFESGNLVTTLTSSPAVAILAPGDTARFTELFTPAWTPQAPGDYDVVFSYFSDSIGPGKSGIAEFDTVVQGVSEGDSLLNAIDANPADIDGPDYGSFDNSFGTTNASFSSAGGSMATLVDIPNGNDKGQVYIQGVQIGLSTLTNGGNIQVDIIDTADADFSVAAGGIPSIQESFTITPANGGTQAFFQFQNGSAENGSYALPASRYWVMITAFAGPNDTILIANDQTFPDGGQSLFYLPNSSNGASWFTGFSASRTYNAPWIRLVSENIIGIGIEENATNSLSVFPNPTAGNVNITLQQGGVYNIELVDMVGNVVSKEQVTVNGNEKLNRNYSDLTSGIYLLNVSGEGFTKTTKLTIQ